MDFSAVSASLHSNVRPEAYVNPTPQPKYNLLVIGGGSAGLVAARIAAEMGAKVALVEKHFLGGDCLNYGCVPSKALIRAARAHHERRTGGYGLEEQQQPAQSGGVNGAMAFVRSIRLEISKHDSVAELTRLGIDVFFGGGKFLSENEFQVNSTTIRFFRAIIATGSRALQPNIKGLHDIPFVTNETIFDLPVMPACVLVAGGGPIGCELSQALNRLGVRVVLTERGVSLLSREDSDVGQAAAEVLQREGVDVRLESVVCSVKQVESGATEVCIECKGMQCFVVVDRLLLASGRVPNIEGLNLDVVDVNYTDRKIVVDQYMATSNKHIFAAGDCCHELKFTHTAVAMARTAVQNALFQKFYTVRSVFSAITVPWVTYMHPEIARVGPCEKTLQRDGIAYQATTFQAHENDRHITECEPFGFIKILTHARSGQLLGAVIVGSEAGEMLSELTLAISHGLTPRDISILIHPYPTRSELVARVCEKWHFELSKAKYGKLVKGWLKDQLK